MRLATTLVLLSAFAVACDRPRDTGPVMQPDSAPAEHRDSGALEVARPAAPPIADPPASPTPAAVIPEQPAPPSPPTGDGDTVQPQAPAVPPPAQTNLVVLSVGPKATELSHPENEPPAAEPRAELDARVVNDAGVLRYELRASAPKPWVVKSTTPFNLTLRPSNGVRLRDTLFDRNDFVNPDAPVKQVNAELEAAPGEYTIDASVELYVCSADLCKRVNEKLRTAFTIPRS